MKKSPNPTDVHVGARVRMRRMMLSLSQEKLGDAIGLTFQQVQKYEKGTNRIGASRLQQIAGILQVPVSFFFEGAPNPPTTPTHIAALQAEAPAIVTDFFATAHAVDLARAFLAIDNPKHRHALIQIAEGLARQPAMIGRAA